MKGKSGMVYRSGDVWVNVFSQRVFQLIGTIFKLIRAIIETNVMTKFHEDWTLNVTSSVLISKTAPPPGGHNKLFTRNIAPPPGGHVFQLTGTIFIGQYMYIFELNQDIFRTHLMTKFHENQTIKSKILTTDNTQRTKGDPKSSP
ncbi:hypothetical protein DPMN_182331 [Dreissena polymorpha]|uniref:Uncharacterized protein n=1 Tax=Dreissena polymorpha TaxID=45954 RepID=A0A9D4I2H5_DREPO|nr:hypothetical protein DPMN_182331 [Dreissena polymorpha]